MIILKFGPVKRLLPIVSVLSAYTMLSLAFSFFGFLHTTESYTYGSTDFLKEFVMHSLFGAVVGIFTFNFRYTVYTAFFPALTDADHLVNVLGLNFYSRMSHSMTFVLLSSLILGKLFGRKGFDWKIAVIPVVAMMSHIAFDALDENPTRIAVFAPISFSEISFGAWTSPVLEALGILIVIVVFNLGRLKKLFSITT